MKFWGNRDIGEQIYLPSTPNSPLKNHKSKQILAPLTLRYNENLKFLENESL